jgi:hypothetical protein
MSLVDYSSLEDEIKNAPEPRTLPDNTQIEVRIIAVNSGTSEKNSNCIYHSPVFDVPSDPMVKDFNTFFWDLVDAKLKNIDPKQQQRNLYSFKEFAEAFKVDLSKPFSWEDNLIGRTGFAILGIKKDPQYGDKNTIKKFVHGPEGPSKKTTSLADPYAVKKEEPF